MVIFIHLYLLRAPTLKTRPLNYYFKFTLSPHFNVSPPSQQHPSGYGTYPSATHQAAGHHCATSSLPRSAPGTLGWPRSSAANATSSSSSSTSSSQLIQQRISVPPNSSQGNLKSGSVEPLEACMLLFMDCSIINVTWVWVTF